MRSIWQLVRRLLPGNCVPMWSWASERPLHSNRSAPSAEAVLLGEQVSPICHSVWGPRPSTSDTVKPPRIALQFCRALAVWLEEKGQFLWLQFYYVQNWESPEFNKECEVPSPGRQCWKTLAMTMGTNMLAHACRLRQGHHKFDSNQGAWQ